MKVHDANNYLFEFVKYMKTNIEHDEKNKEIYEHCHPILVFLWTIDRKDLPGVITKSKNKSFNN